jgi:hypothetical protein
MGRDDKEFSLSASEDGFFVTYHDSNKPIRLAKEQFKEYLNKYTFTESKLSVNPGHYGEWLKLMIESYIDQRKNGHSQYGERVILNPMDVKETSDGESVNIQGSWKCFTESGKFLHDAELHVENLTGPLVRAALSAGLSVAEILKTIIQLEMSGSFVKDEDEKPLETVLNLMWTKASVS